MYRGYYISANGMLNQQRILNVITNNMANTQTAGYKTDNSIPTTFEEELLLIQGKQSEEGEILYRTQEATYTDLEQGTFEFTDSRLDMALQGPVYFNLQDYDDGETYLTRNGQFSIDAEGYLALGSSGRILSEEGAIQLGTADFTVSEDGVITTDDGRQFNLLLSYVEEASDVEKVGDNLFVPYEDAEAVGADVNYKVMQYAYERSNVSVADEMIKAMAASRAFQSGSQVLKIIDEINRRSANDLARI